MKAKRAVKSEKALLKRPAAAKGVVEDVEPEDVVEVEDASDDCVIEEPVEVSKKRPAAAVAPGKTLAAAKAKRAKALKDAPAQNEEVAGEEAPPEPAKAAKKGAAVAAGKTLKAAKATRAKALKDAPAQDEEAADEAEDAPPKLAKALKAAKTGGKKGAAGGDAESPDPQAAVAARKKELRAMAAADLKSLAQGKGLQVGDKAHNVEAILAFEAAERQAEAQRLEDLRGIEHKRREELAAMPSADLQGLCEKKNLKKGGTKEAKVERLLAKAKEDGEIDEEYNAKAREARRSTLMSMDKEAVLAECARLSVDPLVKEVMVERILVRESSNPGR